MIIRSQQLSSFRAEGLRGYRRRLCAYLRTRDLAPVAEMDEPELDRRAGIAIRRAGRHGLNAEWAVAAFAALMFAISARFDEHPAIAAILSDNAIEPNERMNAVNGRVTSEEWEQSSQIAGEDVWNERETV